MPISKRLVLRTGFGIIIALLVLSTAMAYKVQEALSKRSESIHRKFVYQQEILTNLRGILWQTGSVVADYFLDPSPDPAVLAASLARFEKQSELRLEELRKTAEGKAVLAALDLQLYELWATMKKITTSEWSQERNFAFVQNELVPRRDESIRLLRQIEQQNNSSLTEVEREFRKSRQSAGTSLLILLGACILCGLAVAHLSTRYAEALERQSSQQLAEVSEAKAQLERLSARLMEVQEEERTKLSRELHDEIVQNLAVLKMEITNAQSSSSPSAREPLARARDLAERTVRSVRDITLLLRPSLLDDLGLGPALQWLTEEFTRRTRVPCEFSETDLTDDLPDTVKTCVFRVTQEALRNCEKHSHATFVKVSVVQGKDTLEVAIEDNGVGLNSVAPRAPARLGLLGMKERAVMLQGKLTAAARPEGGTCVRLTVPIGERPTAMFKNMEAHV